mmetsp:Transcript_2476/g.4498  ORF Transcript_2476/g.4498 Transcript_2476/m.4498 type:complete len:295 (-) Transcript_2476:335-1219(-)
MEGLKEDHSDGVRQKEGCGCRLQLIPKDDGQDGALDSSPQNKTKAIDFQLHQQQMKSLIANDIRMLTEQLSAEGLLDSHPVHEVMRDKIGFTLSMDLEKSCPDSVDEKSASTALRLSDLISKDLNLSKSHQSLLCVTPGEPIADPFVNHLPSPCPPSAPASLSSPLPPLTLSQLTPPQNDKNYDYGYQPFIPTPLQGTGSLSATNSAPVLVGDIIDIKENHHAISRHQHLCCPCECYRTNQYIQYMLAIVTPLIHGTKDAVTAAVSLSFRKKLLVIPFLLVFLSVFTYINYFHI